MKVVVLYTLVLGVLTLLVTAVAFTQPYPLDVFFILGFPFLFIYSAAFFLMIEAWTPRDAKILRDNKSAKKDLAILCFDNGAVEFDTCDIIAEGVLETNRKKYKFPIARLWTQTETTVPTFEDWLKKQGFTDETLKTLMETEDKNAKEFLKSKKHEYEVWAEQFQKQAAALPSFWQSIRQLIGQRLFLRSIGCQVWICYVSKAIAVNAATLAHLIHAKDNPKEIVTTPDGKPVFEVSWMIDPRALQTVFPFLYTERHLRELEFWSKEEGREEVSMFQGWKQVIVPVSIILTLLIGLIIVFALARG